MNGSYSIYFYAISESADYWYISKLLKHTQSVYVSGLKSCRFKGDIYTYSDKYGPLVINEL